ncbi:MAG: amidohydrolase family protein [Gammaproteobacteria bacterium]|nr:amidohydrolase family protein [Gammaproteobacteria bacterium]
MSLVSNYLIFQKRFLLCSLSLLILSGCMSGNSWKTGELTPEVKALAEPTRSLASFKKGSDAMCYDRAKEPYTAVVDTHFHPRPFGGPALSTPELINYFDSLGVRFVNYFGIGQVLELDSGCTYYLDCKGVAAKPSIKNDFVNGMDAVAFKSDNLHITLSMTFMDLANPEDIVSKIKLYDAEYPGMFKWAGEVNLMKQALVGNLHEPATKEDIKAWAPFMKILAERGIPITIHSDLGNDANPTEFLYLMEYVLKQYPKNKIVWAHMGLSKELTKMAPNKHVEIMEGLLKNHPNLYLDISWDVLFNAYHRWGGIFIDFFNRNPTRILPGSDFVAADNKSYGIYAKELEITSRALKFLNDEAFQNIALGGNYFRILNLNYEALKICSGYVPPVAKTEAM